MIMDRLARRYGLDPWELRAWSPVRLGWALQVLQAGEAADRRALNESAGRAEIMGVWVLNG